ncbi:CoA transferase [Sporosarcina sp. P37]|uniref:CaiB/BaiF CoA transferase family protein n=1 Tax=unclassified Sporosarcina TaxID=2647733 RepID=UPI0009C073DC|nr:MULTISPECIES: CaiB/BaiF CoA-transferase family protein [unclassified Sporosarcina]ARD47958.1 alpha-methylacyl-CoA racemase [Sporosarcina sp. P33]ARK24483.1 CoA transferase [Sporosarcina sp. P37]PID18358.1 CoA transferase [Sporosarcina sp. P35]
MLEGIKVIDFTQYLPGPHATLRLADMGAEVIKVESPAGDPARYPAEKDGGDKYLFRAQNRNKESITLNLKEAADQQIAKDLIADADVVIEGFRPGVTSRLGISYEEVITCKPDIVYCSLTGYGQVSPLSHLGSHDINYMALSGVLSQFKDREKRPVQPTTTMADLVGAMAASESIVAALLKRERTGNGSYIDLAIADVMVTLMTNHVLIESATGEQHGMPRLNGAHVCYTLYETKDGRFISLAALEPKFWENFCLAVEKESWLGSSFTPPSKENPVYQEMVSLFLSRDFEEWIHLSQTVDCCITPVLEAGELADYPYYKARNLIQTQDGLNHVATRYYPDQSETIQYKPSPKHGNHQNGLLQELKSSLK